MKIIKLIPLAIVAAAVLFSSCKPKDGDIKTSVEEKLKTNTATSSVGVTVSDGVATLTGELNDEAAKAEGEKIAAGIKGVKSVVNNITIAPPPPPPFTPPVIVADDPLTKLVNDAIKDHPTVQATVTDGVVTLSGNISKESNKKLMMLLNSLKPKKIENKLTIK